MGTADSGARSVKTDAVRSIPGPAPWTRGGDDDKMPVLEVGTGVGYLANADGPRPGSRACLLEGLGSPGEDDRGSNGGSREDADRFTPALLGKDEVDAGGSEGSSAMGASMFLTGEDDMMKDERSRKHNYGWVVKVGMMKECVEVKLKYQVE